MEILVSGSLAYDRIMDFPGRFSDHIMPDKIHMINVSFTRSPPLSGSHQLGKACLRVAQSQFHAGKLQCPDVIRTMRRRASTSKTTP